MSRLLPLLRFTILLSLGFGLLFAGGLSIFYALTELSGSDWTLKNAPKELIIVAAGGAACLGGTAIVFSLFFDPAKPIEPTSENLTDSIVEQLLETYESFRGEARRAFTVAAAAFAIGLVAILLLLLAWLGLFKTLGIEIESRLTTFTGVAAVITEFVAGAGFFLFRSTSARLIHVSKRLQSLTELAVGVEKAMLISNETKRNSVIEALLVDRYGLARKKKRK